MPATTDFELFDISRGYTFGYTVFMRLDDSL